MTSSNQKRSVIRRSRPEDIAVIRRWLEDEEARGVAGNFLCNWSIIERAHTKRELLVYIDGRSGEPVAFQLGRLLQSGLLQVKSDFRRHGIGKKLVDFCINLARRKDECLLAIQCKPSASIPFWQQMGFTLIPESDPPNRAYRILEKKLSLPADGSPTTVTVRFFPEERNWNEMTPPCSEIVVLGKALIDGTIAFSERVSYHEDAYPSIRDVVVEVEHAGMRLFLDKAKRRDVQDRGVTRCKNGWYLDYVRVR